jgi:hypothetical protein
MSPRHNYQRVAGSKGDDRVSYGLEVKVWYRRPSVREPHRALRVLRTTNLKDILVITRIPHAQPGNGSHFDAPDERHYFSHMSRDPDRAHAEQCTKLIPRHAAQPRHEHERIR